MPLKKIQYTVRAAQQADLDPLAAVFKECALQEAPIVVGHHLDPSINWRAYTEERFRRADTRIFLVETPDGIAGFLEARISDTGRMGFKRKIFRALKRVLRKEPTNLALPRRVGVVEQVYINQSARNPYLGYALFTTAVDWFKSNGLPAVEGIIWSENEDVMRIARYMGFKPARILFRKELA